MIFFTLRDLFTVLRGFYDFVVSELGYCLPVGVLSKLRIFISSCCPVLHSDTNLCNSCTNIVKTAYVKKLLSLIINSILRLLCSGKTI